MSGATECFNMNGLMQNMRSLSAQQGGIIKSLALSNAKSNEVKQKANGLIAKLSLNWATQDVINEAQILRDKLSKLPDYNVTHHCEQEKERLAYGVLRTGVIVPSDVEIDDKGGSGTLTISDQQDGSSPLSRAWGSGATEKGSFGTIPSKTGEHRITLTLQGETSFVHLKVAGALVRSWTL